LLNKIYNRSKLNAFTLSKICKVVLTVPFILLMLSSCQPKSNHQLEERIDLKISSDSSSIEFSGINPYLIEELKTDSLSNEDWQHYFSVYQKVDEDLQELQRPISGTYLINKKSVSFKPDTAFVKDRTYLVELYIQDPNSSVLNQIQTKVNPTRPKMIRKELTF
jgi:hypothetical protein